MRLCFAKDRLYLVERDYDNVNDNVDTVALAMQPGTGTASSCPVVAGRHPAGGQTHAPNRGLHGLHGRSQIDLLLRQQKLLARYVYLTFDSAGTRKERYGVLVLQGL